MSALERMVYQLENPRPGSAGYVTALPELSAILSELSPLVSVGIKLSELQYGDDVSVTITLGFTIVRPHLKEDS
jgi:hypothetical protein